MQKGFLSALKPVMWGTPAANGSGMLIQWSQFVACFIRWRPTGLNIIATVLQNRSKGENEFYVRKMPFRNINGKSKQRVGWLFYFSLAGRIQLFMGMRFVSVLFVC